MANRLPLSGNAFDPDRAGDYSCQWCDKPAVGYLFMGPQFCDEHRPAESIGTDPRNHAAEGDERIRTAVPDGTNDPVYEHRAGVPCRARDIYPQDIFRLHGWLWKCERQARRTTFARGVSEEWLGTRIQIKHSTRVALVGARAGGAA